MRRVCARVLVGWAARLRDECGSEMILIFEGMPVVWMRRLLLTDECLPVYTTFVLYITAKQCFCFHFVAFSCLLIDFTCCKSCSVANHELQVMWLLYYKCIWLTDLNLPALGMWEIPVWLLHHFITQQHSEKQVCIHYLHIQQEAPTGFAIQKF